MSVYVDLDILALKKIENHCDTIATVLDVNLQPVKFKSTMDLNNFSLWNHMHLLKRPKFYHGW